MVCLLLLFDCECVVCVMLFVDVRDDVVEVVVGMFGVLLVFVIMYLFIILNM